jgi:hypothetical protein
MLKIIGHFFLLLASLSVYAHPAQTDSEGCHTDPNTEKYHCHSSLATGTRSIYKLSGEKKVSQSEQRTIKLSPQVRILERERSVPTIQLEMIQHFLSRPRIITEAEMNSAGYILENIEQAIYSTRGNEIYVLGLDEEPVGTKYTIVSLGQTYRSPLEGDEGEVLAYEATYLGEAILKEAGEPAILDITKAVHEIKNGNYLLPMEAPKFEEDFYPHSPQNLEDAYIVGVIDSGSFVSRYQIAVINKGLDDKIERGHILTVRKNSRLVSDTFGGGAWQHH